MARPASAYKEGHQSGRRKSLATEPRLDVHMEYTPLVLVAFRGVVALLIVTLLQLLFCQAAGMALLHQGPRLLDLHLSRLR